MRLAGSRTRGQAARLGVADQAMHATPEFEADFRQLRGFARAGLAADDAPPDVARWQP